MSTDNLLVELFVEELPPKALKKLGEAFGQGVRQGLVDRLLVKPGAGWQWFASPRRLAVSVKDVEAQQSPRVVTEKLMPVSVAFDAEGKPTPALLKKMTAKGFRQDDLSAFERCVEGKAEVLFFSWTDPGFALEQVLGDIIDEALAKLPIPKVMTYQLADGWTDVKFVRPAHGLVALHGKEVVKVSVLGLDADRITHGHRFEAAVDPIEIAHADAYAETLEAKGAVMASFAARRAKIKEQLRLAAESVGGGARPIEDADLLDEVTALVERPNVLVCAFESLFLEVPPECLILTMKANQKYFPLLDAAGELTNKFLVVSNITPGDASAVRQGNERVVRPRLADAKFFFDQDRKKTLASRVPGLGKVVYHNKLGTQGERVERVRAIAHAIAEKLGDTALVAQADQAALLAKADLLTDMVGEFPELQGTMGRYYALHDGVSAEVADAIEDHYKPRFAGDALPRGEVGVVVALADKLETLVGMFGIGNLPTGDKDPFALRRHALGVVRMLVERDLPLSLDTLIQSATAGFRDIAGFERERAVVELQDFIYERVSGTLREQGYSTQEVDATLALRPQRMGDVPKRLAAVRAFAELPDAAALAAANKRIGNILKKSQDVDPHVNRNLLPQDAEKGLFQAMEELLPIAEEQFKSGNYTGSLQTLAQLRRPVDRFFDEVMVNADELDLRLNRLGLLTQLHGAMNRVADLSRLAA